MEKKNNIGLSIIDKGLKIEGSILGKGKLIIKGQVTGTIEGSVVIIADGGEVNSNLTKVASMTIGGSFQGEVVASNELIILSTGVCIGKVECKDFVVENGGVLNAEVFCKRSSKLLTEGNTKLIDTSSNLNKLKEKKQINL